MKKKSITTEVLARMVQKGFDGVDKRFDKVDDKLDHIEKLLIAEHRRRIERLEIDVRQLKELLSVK